VNPFQSLRDYEEYVYTLRQRFPSIQRSTLVVVQRGRRVAVLQGELTFAQGYRITVKERLSFDAGSVEIAFYGYELWHGADKLAWYDAQPHPNDFFAFGGPGGGVPSLVLSAVEGLLRVGCWSVYRQTYP